MAKMKTEFELIGEQEDVCGYAEIIPKSEGVDAHVCFSITEDTDAKLDLFIRLESLETFAVNILKAIGSKKLK